MPPLAQLPRGSVQPAGQKRPPPASAPRRRRSAFPGRSPKPRRARTAPSLRSPRRKGERQPPRDSRSHAERFTLSCSAASPRASGGVLRESRAPRIRQLRSPSPRGRHGGLSAPAGGWGRPPRFLFYLASPLVARFSPAIFSPPSRAVRVGLEASEPNHVTTPAQRCSEEGEGELASVRNRKPERGEVCESRLRSERRIA